MPLLELPAMATEVATAALLTDAVKELLGYKKFVSAVYEILIKRQSF